MDFLLGPKPTYTTGEIAKLLDVNINTVVKWFETGQLEGYKLPGSHARRIPRSVLINFLAKRDFTIAPAADASHIGAISHARNQVKGTTAAVTTRATGRDRHQKQDHVAPSQLSGYCNTPSTSSIFSHRRSQPKADSS